MEQRVVFTLVATCEAARIAERTEQRAGIALLEAHAQLHVCWLKTRFVYIEKLSRCDKRSCCR